MLFDWGEGRKPFINVVHNVSVAGEVSVRSLATEVLKDLASRVNNITVPSVVSAVLQYLT